MKLISFKSPSNYVAPTVPVLAKCGAFWIGDDLASDSTWAPRYDNISAGSITGTNTVRNSSGWVTPEGNRLTWTFNGTSSVARCNGLVSMATADDPPLEVVMWYRVVSTNAGNTLFGWSSTSSTTPKRILLFTSGPYRWTQQATTNVFGHNASNLLQQMVRVCVKNNGAGTDTTIWRNEDLDPIDADGTLQMNVAAQAVNTFTIGAQDNGGSVTNFSNIEVFALWIRDPAAAPLTTSEGVELHNFVMGGYDSAPYYRGSETFFLPMHFGQSNSFANGLGTGVVAGLPDTLVQVYLRSLNNTAFDPTGLIPLDLRGTVHGSQHYWQYGTFNIRHHQAGVGKGATNAGSDWGGQNGSGPVNSLQGYYSTSLASECRRNIFMAKARFGGNPIIHCTMWQGENDAAAGSIVAGQYAANHTAIKTYIRGYIQQAFGLSNVPYHYIKLNPAQTGGGIVLADLNTINSGIDSIVAADSYCSATSWADLTGSTYIQVDNLHAKAAAYQIVAGRIATAAKSFDSRL